MTEQLVKWITENALNPRNLATILVVVFLMIFMGVLPSPMLTAIAQVTREHADIASILRQICRNTAKTQNDLDGCYYEKDPR